MGTTLESTFMEEQSVEKIPMDEVPDGMTADLVRVSEHITDDGRGKLRLHFYEEDEYSEHGYLTEIFRKLSNSAKKVIKDLKETDFIQLVENVSVNEES